MEAFITSSETVYCITSDIDWASDYSINDLLENLSRFQIKPTVFATHPSPVLKKFESQCEVGLHPNFLPGSSHGNDFPSVISHLFSHFPSAQTFRSHTYFDCFSVTQLMYEKGIRFDSNLCLYLQPNISSLRHGSGITRFPVFWEDDVHWLNSKGDWNFDRTFPHFLTPGLKIINVHPFFFSLNIPNQEFYAEHKKHITSLNSDAAQLLRYKGDGTRTFILRLLEELVKRRVKFMTLSELYLNDSKPSQPKSELNFR